MADLRRIARNAAHLLGSQAVNFALGLVASAVMARSLGPTELGVFHQVQWLAGTASVLLSMGFVTSLTKFAAEWRAAGARGNLAAALRFIMRTELLVGLVSTALLVAGARRVSDYYFSPREARYFVLAFLALTPGLQTALLSGLLEGAQVFRYQGLHSLTVTPLALATKAGLLLAGYGLGALLWCNLGFALANLAFYAWASRREGLWGGAAPAPEDPGWKRKLLRYNWSLSAIQLVDLVVWSRSENYFLGRYCQAAQIAYYNLAQNLSARFLGTIPALLWKLLLPVSAELRGAMRADGLRRAFGQSLRYSAFVAFPAAVLCYLSAGELVTIIYGRAYAPAAACFRLLCAGAALSSLAQPVSAVIYSHNLQAFTLYYGAVLAGLNLALDFLLIPRYGAVGASACYTAVTSLGVVGGFAYVRLRLGLGAPFRSWAKCLLACAGAAPVAAFLLDADLRPFEALRGLEDWMHARTGHDFAIFLGPRTLRLLWSLGVGSLLYLLLAFLLFRPGADDRRILGAMDRILPRPLLRWMLKEAATHAPGLRRS